MKKLYWKGNYKTLIAAGLIGCGLSVASASLALAKQPATATGITVGESTAGTYLPPVFSSLPNDAI